MLPYTPLHSSAVRMRRARSAGDDQRQPFERADRLRRRRSARTLAGIADAFLIGERPIARRVDDSVARVGAFGPVILRRVARLCPGRRRRDPVLGSRSWPWAPTEERGHAGGGWPGVCQPAHRRPGSLRRVSQLSARPSTIWCRCTKSAGAMPSWCTTPIRSIARRLHALELPAPRRYASSASPRARRLGAGRARVPGRSACLGVSFDGTGYGDDGTIWGGEIFAGSVAEGFERVAPSAPGGPGRRGCRGAISRAGRRGISRADGRTARPGSDAVPLPARATQRAGSWFAQGLRTFPTTSMGRLFDAAAALLGFTREVTFEGQAAMWLEHLARDRGRRRGLSVSADLGRAGFPSAAHVPGVRTASAGRSRLTNCARVSRAAWRRACVTRSTGCVSAYGGGHGRALRRRISERTAAATSANACSPATDLEIWTNHAVPPNDGGISLGQAALAAFRSSGPR